MPSVHELQGKRAAKVAEARAIIARAESEKRDVNAEEDRAFEAAQGEVEQLDQALRRQQFLDNAERAMDGQPVAGSARDSRSLARRFSVGKALREHMDGKLTGVELEWQQENRSGHPDAISVPTSCFLGERREQTVGNLTEGGVLVPQEIGPLIEALRPVLTIERLGATVLRNLVGNLTLPRIDTPTATQWVGEHQAPTRSTVGFGEVNLWPKTCAAELEVSRRLLIQAENVEQILRDDIGRSIAVALDAAAINGQGGVQPYGILFDSSIPSGNKLSLGAAGGAPTIDTPADLIGLVEDANAGGGNSGFLTNSKVKRTLSKLKDGNTRIYSEAELWRGERVIVSNSVPSTFSEGASGAVLSAIIFSGRWSDLVVAYWSNVDILINPYHPDVASGRRADPCVPRCGHRASPWSKFLLHHGSDHDLIMNTERRSSPLEVRTKGRTLQGYAAVYGAWADLGSFKETIAPGAFTATLAEGRDVLALADHDTSRVLGRTKAKTLRLAEDSRGLEFDLSLPATQPANDILELVRSGNAGGMSFAFALRENDDQWDGDSRTLRSVDLFEISVVAAWPAYEATVVHARSRPTGGHWRVALARRWLEIGP